MAYSQGSPEEASEVLACVLAGRATEGRESNYRDGSKLVYNDEFDLYFELDRALGDGVVERRWEDGRRLSDGCPFYALTAVRSHHGKHRATTALTVALE